MYLLSEVTMSAKYNYKQKTKANYTDGRRYAMKPGLYLP
jgi:hypothetical protein